MRWSFRNIMIGTSAAAAAIGLAVSLVVVLAGRGVPPAAQKPSPGRSSQLYSPFTGEPVTALGPVLAVKIDNLAPARPQTGLAGADIVYVLPVEGGLSRFLAVFSSHVPPVIGPVRSAREDDLELLRQFGRPAFAYSGAQPQLLPVVERARTVDLYAGRVPVSPWPGYFRDLRRVAPHNLYARTSRLLAEAPGASQARDIGFRFGPAPAGGACDGVVPGVVPGRLVHVPLVGQGRTVAGLDGRHGRARGRGRPAERGHRGHPVHQGADLAVPGGGRPAAVRGEHRHRHRRSAARREGLPGPLVPA